MSNDKYRYFVKEGDTDTRVSYKIASVPTYYDTDGDKANPHTYFSNFPNEGEQPLVVIGEAGPLFGIYNSSVDGFWGNLDSPYNTQINEDFTYKLQPHNTELEASAPTYIDPKSAPWLPSTGVLHTSTSTYDHQNIPIGMSSYVEPIQLQASGGVDFDYYKLNFNKNNNLLSIDKWVMTQYKWESVEESTVYISNPTHCLLTIQAPGGRYINGCPGGGGSCCQFVVNFEANPTWCVVPRQEHPVLNTTTTNGIFLTNYHPSASSGDWFKVPTSSKKEISIFIPGGTENLQPNSSGYFCFNNGGDWNYSESQLAYAARSCKFGLVYFASGAAGFKLESNQDIDDVRTYVSNRYSFGNSSSDYQPIFTIPLRPGTTVDGGNSDSMNNNLSLFNGGGASPSAGNDAPQTPYGVGGQSNTGHGVGAFGIYWYS